MSYLPDVSIIIPCRNEERFIQKCLDSINDNRYPKEKVEILVIDGMSEDGTRKILEEYKKKFPRLIILNNPKKIAASGLNTGIRNAKNDIIIRMDAHATYKNNYILKCISYLYKYNADNVGGIWVMQTREDTLVAKAIAITLSHFFGTGNAYYKLGVKEMKWVDTVPFGCYRREIFDKIGFFNEKLKRSQDMEFNLRLRKAGGKILLIPEIVGYYFVRSNFKDFFLHNIEDGIWAILPLKFVKIPFKLRHYTPFLFIASILFSFLLSLFFPVFWFLFFLILIFYFGVNIYFSTAIAIKEKNIKYLILLPVIFAARHIGYGLGSFVGLFKLFTP